MRLLQAEVRGAKGRHVPGRGCRHFIRQATGVPARGEPRKRACLNIGRQPEAMVPCRLLSGRQAARHALPQRDIATDPLWQLCQLGRRQRHHRQLAAEWDWHTQLKACGKRPADWVFHMLLPGPTQAVPIVLHCASDTDVQVCTVRPSAPYRCWRTANSITDTSRGINAWEANHWRQRCHEAWSSKAAGDRHTHTCCHLASKDHHLAHQEVRCRVCRAARCDGDCRQRSSLLREVDVCLRLVEADAALQSAPPNPGLCGLSSTTKILMQPKIDRFLKRRRSFCPLK